jgi:uncharacterized membrane protein YfcA
MLLIPDGYGPRFRQPETPYRMKTKQAVSGQTPPEQEKFMGFLNANVFLMIAAGVAVGVGASFTGLGGGFLMIPLLLFLGYSAQKAVGTSFLAIFVISISALLAHNKLANVDYRAGILLGIGGVIGAQIGARLVEHVSTASFKKIFALVLVGLAAYLFSKK